MGKSENILGSPTTPKVFNHFNTYRALQNKKRSKKTAVSASRRKQKLKKWTRKT